MDIIKLNGIEAPFLAPFIKIFENTFSNEPMFKFMFFNEETRKEQVRWSVGCKFKLMKQKYTTFTTSGIIKGYSLWFSPDITPTTTIWEQLKAGYAISPFKFGMKIFKRMLKCGAHEQKLLKEFTVEPHWILDVITTDPPYQRQGLGGELMAPIFKIAEKTHVPCLVITHNERNVRFYLKYGFKLLLTEAVLENGPKAFVCEKVV